ncbi:hypothetical protein AALO_G00203160 [Alosa alosa]|uniref:Ig-like domain-containing protein n=1 Tax=Alosa alosa TaxID=278164 RepID=A0AAV6G7Q7_9TELE|nr:uncharacterized protein si:ch211-149e23.4 [Alosa alosa]XP_048120718.1 uncharacterized protein si:ch211-149e23.4 [Alosa alosa]KAG5269540.1 hypothetical protein AALO_G00203160 [Alosa alosa]
MGPSVLMILGFLLSPALSSDMQDGDGIIFESNVTGILGEDVYLHCLYTGNDPDDLLYSVWKRLGSNKKLAGYFGLKTIKMEGFSLPESTTNLTVKMQVASLNAEGEYICEFGTDDDPLIGHVSLTVLVRPDVTVQTKKEIVNATHYQSVSCTATNAKPAPHISWEINGSAPSDDVFSVQTESAYHANGTLTLASVLRFPTHLSDESTIVCLVQHPAQAEPQRATALVQTFVVPDVTIETGLVPGAGGRRMLRVVNCTALRGRPQPKIAWILSGGENTFSAQKWSDDDAFISSVSFPVGSHEGENVTCVVTHPKLTRAVKKTLPLPTYTLSSVQLVYLNDSSAQRGTALDQLPLEEGEPGMALALEVQGDVPSYQTECTKDGSSLPHGVVLVDDKLTFSGPIALHYAGHYECRASFNKHKASVQLDISVKPAIQAPILVAPTISVRTWIELDSVIIKCSASGAVPAPNVSWSLAPWVTAAKALNTTSFNGSDSVTATLTLPHCLPEESTVLCLVEHQLFEYPERRDMVLPACARPNITVQPSVVWEQGLAYSEVECRVESVRPRANISWLLEDNTKADRTADGAMELLGIEEEAVGVEPYMEDQVVAVSSVRLPLAEHQGKTVVCVVRHQKLLKPERREIQLQAPDPPEIQAFLVDEHRVSSLMRAVCAYSSESGGANITWLLPNNTEASVVSSSAREGSKFKANASYEFHLARHEGSALTCHIHQEYGKLERRVVTVPQYYISLSVMNKTTCAAGDGVVFYRVALQEHLAHQKILLQVKGNVLYSQIVCSSKGGAAALLVRKTSELTSVLEFPKAVSKRDAGQYVCTASFHHISTDVHILVEVTDNAVQHMATIIICFTSALAITLILVITLCVFCKRQVQPAEKDRRKKRESLSTLTSLMQDPRSPELKKAALPGVKGHQYAELVSIVLVQRTTV